MTTPVNFRVKNGLTVANGVAVTAGNVVITNGSLVIGGTVVNSSFINTAADNAYANGVNYADGKAADAYGNAVAVATGSSTNAYSNAVTFAANADNLTTGTLPLARLPATVNISSTLNVTNTVNITTSNVTVSQGNDVAMMTGTVISLTDSLTETGNTYYAAVSHDKLITSKNYSVANVIYSDYGEISRTGMFSVVGLDTTNNSIYVRGVTVNTSVIAIGNTTVFSTINSTAFVGNGALVTSVNATTVGGNSATDLRTYTETYASNATNLASGTVNSARLPAANATVAGATLLVDSVSNTSATAAASAASVKTAYDAAITANTNAASALANASTAYTNAINIAANATNLTSGTVNIARIPVLDIVNNTSISYVATANSVKTAYDAATNAYSNAVSYTDGAISAANVTGYAAAAYTNAITIAANATNLTSGTVNIARIPTVDAVNNTSITLIPVANNVKTAYDAAIAANTLANTAATAASAAYTNAVAIAANATNLTSGTVNSARLPSGNSSTAGAVVLVDSVSNTSTTAAATAASVKTAYDLAVTANTASGAAYTNAVSYIDTKIGTANTAMVANAGAAYTNAVSYTDTKIGTANTAITGNAATAYTNAVSYTDGKILTANGAITGNAATAYTNSVSYTDTKIGTANTAMVANAGAAYTNAIAIAANATNLTSGTVAFARLPTVDSVANTSVVLVPTANNVKTAYDAAITANTNAASAYTNAVSYTDTKIGTANTAMVANASAAYSNSVTYTDTKIGTANTAMVANAAAAYTNAITFAANASNANNGTLAEARLPYRMNQDVRSTDTVTFGNITVTGNITVQGTTTTVNTVTLSVQDNLIYLNANNTTDNPDLGFAGNYNDGTYHHAGFFRDATDGVWKVFDNYAPEPDANAYIDTSNSTFRIAAFQANTLYIGNTSVYGTINTTSFTGTANNATNFAGSSLATIQGQITGNAATAYTNAVSYTDTKIGTANSAITGNAATAYTNAVSYTDTKIGTANTAMAANAATAYTNAIAIAANATNLTSGTVAAARLPTLYLGTTTIQSTSAAQAVSGITTLAAGNTTITGFVSANNLYANGSTGQSFKATVLGAAQGEKSALTMYSTFTGTADNGPRRTVDIVSGFVGGAWGNETLTFHIGYGGGSNDSGNTNIQRLLVNATSFAANSLAFSGITTLAAGNTTVTGFANVTTTLQVGGISTLAANLVMANNAITRPVLAGYTEHEVANTSTTGSYTLDCGAANFWDLTLTGNITIAPTNVPPSTRMWAGTIVAKQDATGGRTITWPTGSKYPGGVAPPATTTANAIDIWSLMTYDGGTSWIVSLTVKGAA